MAAKTGTLKTADEKEAYLSPPEIEDQEVQRDLADAKQIVNNMGSTRWIAALPHPTTAQEAKSVLQQLQMSGTRLSFVYLEHLHDLVEASTSSKT